MVYRGDDPRIGPDLQQGDPGQSNPPADQPTTNPPTTEPPPTAETPTPEPAPHPHHPGSNQDTTNLPPDDIGDIPPPPIPAAPIPGPGIGGIPGTEAGTLSQPGTAGAEPFRTPAFFAARQARFGPGVPMVGGGANGVAGLADAGNGMNPDDAAEILRQLALGLGQGR